jgi:hypothetical protein
MEGDKCTNYNVVEIIINIIIIGKTALFEP